MHSSMIYLVIINPTNEDISYSLFAVFGPLSKYRHSKTRVPSAYVLFRVRWFRLPGKKRKYNS